MLVLVLYILSLVLLVLAAFSVPAPRVALGWLGLAVLVGALLAQHLKL